MLPQTGSSYKTEVTSITPIYRSCSVEKSAARTCLYGIEEVINEDDKISVSIDIVFVDLYNNIFYIYDVIRDLASGNRFQR